MDIPPTVESDANLLSTLCFRVLTCGREDKLCSHMMYFSAGVEKYFHLPKAPTTLLTITAISRSQLSSFLPLPSLPDPVGAWHPLITHSLTDSPTLFLLLLRARADTPPLLIISAVLVLRPDASVLQKYDAKLPVSRLWSKGSKKFLGA